MRFAVLFALPMLAFGADRVDLNTTEKTDFAPGGTVHIEASTGDLNIESWDQPAVEIDVFRSAWNAKTNLKAIQVTKQLSGKDLTVTTSHRRFTGAQVSYRIRVPRNTNLEIHHGLGSVVVYDVAGNVSASVKFGDVLVQVPDDAGYTVSAHTKKGTLYSDAPAAAGQKSQRQLNLRATWGGITIQTIPAHPLLSLN
jgi:hypothetical protein